MINDYRKILVILSAGIGDLFIAVPAMTALRRRFPKAKIDLLTSGKAAEYARLLPQLDTVYVFDNLSLNSPDHLNRKLLPQLKLLTKLRGERYDLAINLYELSTQAGALKMQLLLKLIRPKLSAGRDTNGMPWLGYFDKMRSCDLFVIFDSVQYKKNEWQNRNRIWTPQGPQWLTVPVIHHFGDLINTLPVNNTVGWKDKHLKAIKQNYGKAPYFSAFLPDIEKLYAREYKTLSEVNIASVAMLAARLAVKTKTVLLSENEVDGAATLRLVNICKKFGADTYLAGAGGKDYMFLGDSGSTFIGFVLASLAVYGGWATNNPAVAISTPLLILGVPIFDIIYITISRIKNGQVRNLKEWIEYVGKDHFHHRLLHLGLTVPTAAAFIILVNIILGLGAWTMPLRARPDAAEMLQENKVNRGIVHKHFGAARAGTFN